MGYFIDLKEWWNDLMNIDLYLYVLAFTNADVQICYLLETIDYKIEQFSFFERFE